MSKTILKKNIKNDKVIRFIVHNMTIIMLIIMIMLCLLLLWIICLLL